MTKAFNHFPFFIRFKFVIYCSNKIKLPAYKSSSIGRTTTLVFAPSVITGNIRRCCNLFFSSFTSATQKLTSSFDYYHSSILCIRLFRIVYNRSKTWRGLNNYNYHCCVNSACWVMHNTTIIESIS